MPNLTDREATVLQLRLGILEQAGNCQIPECENKSLHGHTLEEVGRFLGITRERVRQIEVKSIRKSGIDVEKILRQKKSAESVMNYFKDRREHPEKYWVTGEYGSVRTRSAPTTMYPENHKPLVLPKELDEGDTIWKADWDSYCFYVLFHKGMNGNVHMEVKMYPEQYLDTEVTVLVKSIGFQAVVRTSKIGTVSTLDQRVAVNSSMYTYSKSGEPSPTNNTHLEIQINDPDLFDRVGKNFPIEFTAIKHKVNSDFSHKSLNIEVGV